MASPAQLFACNTRSLSAAVTMASLAMALPGQSWGQQQDLLEEISITGSRIMYTSGMNTPVPVTSVTTQELFDFDPGNTISQQLDALPQFFNNGSPQRGDGGNPAVGSGGPGALNIRNLNGAGSGAGISRTLTLLDGARVVPTDKRGTVNTDLFPTALMRSVDVVTGGASAAYGADALGGVVNFVLDRQFEGLKVSTGAGMHDYKGEAKQWEVSIAGGKGFGRLHAIGSIESRQTNQVQPDRYRWKNAQQQWGYVLNPEWSPGAPMGVPQRLSMPNVATVNSAPTGLFRGTGTPLDWHKFTVDGTGIEPFELGDMASLPGQPGSTATLMGGPEADVNFITSNVGPNGMEAISRSTFVALQYEFTDNFKGFVQGMAGRTESNNTSNNANFVFNNTWAPRIAIDNAYLPEEVRQIMLAHNLSEIPIHKTSGQFDGRPEIGSNREARNVFTQWQYSFGFDWAFAEGWNMRASWQRGESKRNSQAINLKQVDRAHLGMDAVRHPETGEIVCRVNLYNPTLAQLAESVAGRISSVPLNPYVPAGVPGNTIPLSAPVEPQAITDCVPYNVLGSGNMSQEAIDYVGTLKTHLSNVYQDFAEILITGTLHEGWGAGPIAFAGGLTWREQDFLATALPVSVDLLGPPINVPSLGIRGIGPGFSGGSGNLHLFSAAPTIGGDMNVWEWFAETSVPLWESGNGQRATVDMAFRRSDYNRSGNIDSWKIGTNLEVTESLRFRITRSRDVREPSFAELFDAQGVGLTIMDPNFNNESYLTSGIRGGNPNLRPEVANTNTAGFVYQPSFVSWLDGVSLSLDWYDVDIRDAVAQLGGQRIVDECAAGVAALCAMITRSPETGQVINLNDGFLNVAAAAARGVDMEVIWRAEPNFLSNHSESFNLRWLTGYMIERSDTPLGGVPQDRAGVLGMPKVTSNFTANYRVDAYSFQIMARFVDSVRRNVLWVQGRDVDDNTIASMTWFNARLGYNGEFSNGATYNIGFNIQNIFNKEPPIYGMTNNTYDQFGRRYNLSFNMSM